MTYDSYLLLDVVKTTQNFNCLMLPIKDNKWSIYFYVAEMKDPSLRLLFPAVPIGRTTGDTSLQIFTRQLLLLYKS